MHITVIPDKIILDGLIACLALAQGFSDAAARLTKGDGPTHRVEHRKLPELSAGNIT
jgi:hypothetical protein